MSAHIIVGGCGNRSGRKAAFPRGSGGGSWLLMKAPKHPNTCNNAISISLFLTILFLCNGFHRSASLQHVNSMLREQLDQATSANQQLTLDIQKLTNDWNKAREELEARDEEEQAYFANEHVRLMDMWKTMNNFRRQFNEMKSATQRYVKFYIT